MQTHGLLKTTQAIRVKNLVAAGTTAIKSSGVDMLNADGVAFQILCGTITAGSVVTVKLQESVDDVDGNYADLAGTSLAIADTNSNKVLITEIYKPLKRWVRAVITITTQNFALDGIMAIKHGLRNAPPTQDASIVSTSNVFAGPAEGTP